MELDELRAYCLSLSTEVEEKFPFQQFKAARDVLAFYINGHIFCYLDINNLRRVTIKYHAEELASLLEQYDYCLTPTYNGNRKYWLGLDATRAETRLIKRLIADSFAIVQKRK